MLVLAAATGAEGYDSRPQLDDAQWATLLANLDRLAEAAAARGVTAVLHPHVGTMVETVLRSSGCSPVRRYRCAWTPVIC
jgi:inosose dehydratase